MLRAEARNHSRNTRRRQDVRGILAGRSTFVPIRWDAVICRAPTQNGLTGPTSREPGHCQDGLVLNALAGRTIAKGLASQPPHGRFLDIGKRNIHQDRHIGLWPFHENISFRAIDLGDALAEQGCHSAEATSAKTATDASRTVYHRYLRTRSMSLWLGDLDSNQGCSGQSREFYR